MKKFIIAFLILSAMSTGVVLAEDGGLNVGGSVDVNAGLNTNLGNGNRSSYDVKSSNSAKTEVSGDIESRMRERAGMEIDRRVGALTKFFGKIDDRKRVSSDDKDELNATADTQIKLLTDLKTKIGSDDSTKLKDDVQSITKSYRTFALIIPQAAIKAAASRITTTADLMATFGSKLDTRINDAKTAGKDVSALETAYTDFTAKIADAKVQAQAAVDLTVNLKPDNGDQTIFDANKAALMAARTKLQAARADLQKARDDAHTIVKGLKDMDLGANAGLNIKGEAESNSNSNSTN